MRAGAKCADLCRKHGMSERTFYALKAKSFGLTVPEAKRLKALEYEEAKLKRLLAEAPLHYLRVTSREIVWLLLEQVRPEFVPVFHRL